MTAVPTSSAVAATAEQRFRDAGGESAIDVRQVALGDVAGWIDDREAGVIRHRTGRFFSIVGIGVEAGRSWGWWSRVGRTS